MALIILNIFLLTKTVFVSMLHIVEAVLILINTVLWRLGGQDAEIWLSNPLAEKSSQL